MFSRLELGDFFAAFTGQDLGMLAGLCLHRKTLARLHSSWLRHAIEGYLTTLAAQEFTKNSMRVRVFLLLAFGEFTAELGIQDVLQIPLLVDPFLAQVKVIHRRRLYSTMRCFVRYLHEAQILPKPSPMPPPSPSSFAGLLEEYLQFCCEHRGLRPGSLEVIQRTVNILFEFLATDEIQDAKNLKPEVIHRFLKSRGKSCGRSALQTTCWALRGFLSHLYRRGIVAIDLRPAVIAPRIYAQEQCPRFLTRTEVDAVLAAIDRQSAQGKRDYAMAMLLAVYGLRSIEVIRLRLQDIDWRGQRLYIDQRKAGNCTTYPLSLGVADALVAYLQHGRPASKHRDVFLTMSAPHRPMATGDSLANRVKHYMVLAGVRIAHPGTHSFRYSCAQRLFEQSMSLKTIGDYLGHQDPSTTQRYTKIALDQLREVATSYAEDLL
jgi:integrase/recombinase XerD